MKKELIERFKKGEIAINLETQNEWNEFMQWLEENTDLRWQSGHKPTGQDYWWARQKETGVSSKMGHFDIADYSEVYEIVKYKDLKERKGMKTSEFIKRVEELGYEVDNISFPTVLRIVAGEDVWIASVETNALNKVDTRYDANIPSELFDLLVEYAKTPLEEREEPKRYYLRPKGMKLIRTNFVFNYYVNDGDWSLYGKDETRLAKTRFTIKELEDLGINPEHYDLEEVE